MGTMHPRRPFANLFPHELESEGELHLKSAELRRVLRRVRRLTRQLEDAMTHQPLALIGVTAGGAFVLGALTGSRLARGLAAMAVGFVLATRTRERLGRRRAERRAPDLTP